MLSVATYRNFYGRVKIANHGSRRILHIPLTLENLKMEHIFILCVVNFFLRWSIFLKVNINHFFF